MLTCEICVNTVSWSVHLSLFKALSVISSTVWTSHSFVTEIHIPVCAEAHVWCCLSNQRLTGTHVRQLCIYVCFWVSQGDSYADPNLFLQTLRSAVPRFILNWLLSPHPHWTVKAWQTYGFKNVDKGAHHIFTFSVSDALVISWLVLWKCLCVTDPLYQDCISEFKLRSPRYCSWFCKLLTSYRKPCSNKERTDNLAAASHR